MSTAGTRVLFVGLRTELGGHCWVQPGYECADVRPDVSADAMLAAVARHRPDVIVSQDPNLPALNHAPYSIRRRWIAVAADAEAETVAAAIETCYVGLVYGLPLPGQPLMSVYTAAYRTDPAWIAEAYESLCRQSYHNWEWVIVDDGSPEPTAHTLLGDSDPRVRYYRAPRDGRIGAVKDQAARLCRGEFLVEMDHDDWLADEALEEVRRAFQSDPALGFVYSNCAEPKPDGTCNTYSSEFWRDRYRDVIYRGKPYKEQISPDIYGGWGPNHWERHAWYLTVGPNHLRAFRASEFHRLGGYNWRLPVADDWDLMARCFLLSKCRHIDRLLYFQRCRPGQSETARRNKSIQDHLALARDHYAVGMAQRTHGLDLRPGYAQYWHPEVAPRKGDVVLDCGAFDGADTLRFAAVGAEVHAFEPSPRNWVRLLDRVDGQARKYELALSDTAGEARFASNGSDADRMAPDGAAKVRTVRLDDWCAEQQVRPSYIKMDIEGAELAALKGAEQTIREHGPRLAVCVYHRRSDVWEIPAWLRRARPDYRIAMAKHGPDVVMYAWPGPGPGPG
jgi:FkbM family methyltransferase